MSEINTTPPALSYRQTRVQAFRAVAQPILQHSMKPPVETEDNLGINDAFADALMGVYLDHAEAVNGTGSRGHHKAMTMVRNMVMYLEGASIDEVRAASTDDPDVTLLPMNGKTIWEVPRKAASILRTDPAYEQMRKDMYNAHQENVHEVQAERATRQMDYRGRRDLDAYIRDLFHKGSITQEAAEGLLMIFDFERSNASRETIISAKNRAAEMMRLRISAAEEGKRFWDNRTKADNQLIKDGMSYLKMTFGMRTQKIVPRPLNTTITVVAADKNQRLSEARDYVLEACTMALGAIVEYTSKRHE